MAIEYYSSIDLNKNELQNAVIQNAGSAPGSPAEGQIYYDSTSGDKALHFYNGSAWIRVAGQATAQATDTIASGDFMAFSDESETGDINNKITIDNLFKTAPALLTEAAVADGDYIMFLDGGATGDAKKEAVHDLATLFAGSGLTATNSVIAVDTLNQDTTGTADHVTIVDNESTDEENQITFIEGAAGAGSRGLEADGDFTYNPSSGTVTATIFKGNIDAVDGDFDGTLEADAITVGGTALNTVIAGVTVTNATTAAVATTVTITDNENTNEENAIVFTAGGDVDGGNLGLEADGNATYNPSSGTITATIFKGNIDAVDGDFDGTLEADAITIGGTNIVSGNVITSLGAEVSTASDNLVLTADTLTVTSANANDPVLQLKNTTNDANGARLNFIKDKGAAGADNDEIGEILFTGDDAAQAQTDFGQILVNIGEADNTDEAGIMTFKVAASDGTTTALRNGLVLTGHKTSSYVDVTLGAGSSSTVTIPGNLVVTGETTTVNVTTTTTSNGVVFEGTTGDGHDATLKSVVADADVTYTLPNVTGHVALFAADPSTTTISSTPAELNKLDGATVTTAEINLIDGGTARGTTAVADGDGFLHNDGGTMRMTNVSKLADLFAGTNISASSSVLSVADASASAKGVVELATAAEVITGTATDKAVTADTLAAKSVVCDIDVSSLTDANIVTITHNLGTADIVVQVYDKTTEANIMCDIARTTDDFSTASTSVVSIDFGTAPPNDCRALITSLAGATAGSIAYT